MDNKTVPEGWERIAALGETVPDTSYLYGPDSYAAMNPETKGDWAFVMDGNTKLGFLWTDWDKAAGVVGFDETDYFENLRSFMLAAKNANVPAGSAFSAARVQAEKTAPKGVAVSETETGILSDVLESIFETSTENDNGDDS